MFARDYLQLILYVGILLLLTKPMGIYLDQVFSGRKTFLSPLFHGLEQGIYRVCGIDPEEEQNWKRYALNLLVFSFATLLLTFFMIYFQKPLPLNPQGLERPNFHLTFNTAISFLTNTNWQSYGGESTMSYLSQMVALTFQNFISAAVGLSVAVALIRGIARKQAKGIGNFWTDLVRSNLYVLLPISLIFAVFLISQGIIQNFHSYQEITTLEGAKQVIAQGPVASQIAIKMLGTNGGGFFNANAAHPYENPTPLSNFVQILSIFLIPSALTYLLGRMVGKQKHGWAVWATMAIVFLAGVFICAHYEYSGNPNYLTAGLSSPANWEGKEVRFGIFNSALFATITTDASCGAVNAMHDSFTPLGGLVPLLNIELGEIIFGGVGAGLYGMMMFIIITIFIAGLMVGRTPEYLGKKIESLEVKMAMIALIAMALCILGFTGWGVVDARGLAGLLNLGPHGLSEILYAFSSATGNNGSAFAGLTANAPFYDYTLAIAFFIGRFAVIIPMLVVAGSLSQKKFHPEGEASFPVTGPLFVTLLIGVILLVGALTFFPALTLGPVFEHFEMLRGVLY